MRTSQVKCVGRAAESDTGSVLNETVIMILVISVIHLDAGTLGCWRMQGSPQQGVQARLVCLADASSPGGGNGGSWAGRV